MKGNALVIGHLNTYLQIELTGQKQYLMASAACGRWGYERLRERQLAYSHEEIAHSARVASRVLFLEGAPDPSDTGPIAVGASVEDQLERDKTLVEHAIEHLRKGVVVCRDSGDEGTRSLFEEMIVDEESHLDWLEKQLSLIGQLGLRNYLQQQMA